MANIPEDPWLRRAQAWWKFAIVVIAALIGAAIIIDDALLHPPADPTTSGFGLLLMGLVPAAAADLLRGKGGS